MTDLTGNQPDMVAQVNQQVVKETEQPVSDWEVAKFERMVSQELAAIDSVNTQDMAAKMSVDKLFETLSDLDAAKAAHKTNMKDLMQEVIGKSADRDFSSGNTMEGRLQLMTERMDEANIQQFKMYEALGQHSDVMVKIGWIKDIAVSSISTLKNTINHNS